MFMYRQNDVQQYLNAVLDLAVWAYMCRLLGRLLVSLLLISNNTNYEFERYSAGNPVIDYQPHQR